MEHEDDRDTNCIRYTWEHLEELKIGGPAEIIQTTEL